MRLKALILGLLTLPILMTSAGGLALNPLEDVCRGEARTSPACREAETQSGDPSTNPVVDTIATAANIVAIIAGIGAVIIIIWSGFKFVTAGGNPEKAREARSTLTGAVVGLVIVALAWVIVSIVTTRIIQ
ncbi:MAG: pilin [Candidatus Saccharimonadales bacterium]